MAVLGIAGGVAAVLAAGGGSGHLQFPNSIAGQPRVHSAALENIANGVAEQAKLGSEKPQVAFYGPEASPQFLVMAYDFSVDFDTAYTGALAGIKNSSGGSARIGSGTRSSDGSTQYECAPLTTSSFSGEFCLWGDDDTTGMVLTLNAPASPNRLVSQVHDAVVR